MEEEEEIIKYDKIKFKDGYAVFYLQGKEVYRIDLWGLLEDYMDLQGYFEEVWDYENKVNKTEL